MRHNICIALLAPTFISLLFCAIGNAQEAASTSASGQSPDASGGLAAIRAGSKAFTDVFNKHDAKAVAQLWTEGGDYVDESGRRLAGREAIQAGYARLFAENPRARLRTAIESLRLLNDLTAIEDGHTYVDPPPAGAPSVGKYTAVHVKVDGKWLMTTVRESRIETPSAYKSIADLEWLIGEWTAEEHGFNTQSTCRWIANKSFVERSYTFTHSDGATGSGVQLIGWNPQRHHVQSWNFSSDGGYAVGVWTPHESGWSGELEGTTGDGRPTTAVNRLTRLDDNAYVWQSVQRTLAGEPLPDTDEVVLKRRRVAQ